MAEAGPDVTAVIPTRNRWGMLGRALRSALAQRDVQVEAIVVDDASSGEPDEETRSILERARVIRLDRHGGVSAARNAGVRLAGTEWIAFLDDDDVWAPAKLSTVIGAIQARAADFGYSSVIGVDDEMHPLWIDEAPPAEGLVRELLRSNVVPGGGSGVVARTDAVREIGGFDIRFAYAADWDMWLRLAEDGRAAKVDEPLVAYRRGGWVLRDEQARLEELELLSEKHAALARRHGASLDWSKYERGVARSFYVAGHRRAAAIRYLAEAVRHRDRGALARAAGSMFSLDLTNRILGKTPASTPDWLGSFSSLPRATPQRGPDAG